tara:strand:+ start:2122 stop:2361 length:240 start_codon:yes stop_codon:yes gene_type:complete
MTDTNLTAASEAAHLAYLAASDAARELTDRLRLRLTDAGDAANRATYAARAARTAARDAAYRAYRATLAASAALDEAIG